MKRIYLSILPVLLLLFPVIMSAQNITQEIGVIIGANYFIWTSESWDSRPIQTIQPSIGVSYEIGMSKHFAIKTDLIYNRIESKYTYNNYSWGGSPSENIDATIKSDNIFIPILGNWSFGEKTKFSLNSGPALNAIFNKQFSYDYGTHTEYKSNPSVNYTFYWSFGCGVSVPLGKKLMLNGDVSGSVNPRFPNKLKNTSIQGFQSMVLVGVSYKLGSSKKEE